VLCFVDSETTGLSARLDYLLEVGVVLTTNDLVVVARKSVLVWDDKEAIQKRLDLNDVVRRMHTDNGLLRAAEQCGVPGWQAEQELLTFIDRNAEKLPGGQVTEGCLGEMAGSGVQFDRKMLAAHMPTLHSRFHGYRNIDVSTLRTITKRWWPADIAAGIPPGRDQHRVDPDVENTIEQMRYLRRVFRGACREAA